MFRKVAQWLQGRKDVTHRLVNVAEHDIIIPAGGALEIHFEGGDDDRGIIGKQMVFVPMP